MSIIGKFAFFRNLLHSVPTINHNHSNISHFGAGRAKKRKSTTKRNSSSVKKARQQKKFETPSDDDEEVKDPETRVLKSLGHSRGFGDQLQELLPQEYSSRSDVVAAFLSFIYERQTIYVKKRSGKMCLTNNEILSTKWFTNMYRELDRGTMYFRYCIQGTDLASSEVSTNEINTSLVSAILFKSFVYCLINKVETFMDFGSIPSMEEYPSFRRFVIKKHSEGVVIFTAAHQTEGLTKFLEAMDHVQKNITKITKDVVDSAQKQSLKEVFDRLKKVPHVGNFFAWQILCYLLECKILGANTDNQWTSLGPGAKKGLNILFPDCHPGHVNLYLTRLLRDLCAIDGPKSAFQKLGLQFPAFLNKPFSLKNVEHALCEFSKYYRCATEGGKKSRDYSDDKSRKHLDDQVLCDICQKPRMGLPSVQCNLCGTITHESCDVKYEEKYHQDGSWLCSKCHISEQLWHNQDFSYNEAVQHDKADTGRTPVSTKPIKTEMTSTQRRDNNLNLI